MWNPRLATIGLAGFGMMLSMLTAVGLLIGLGNRKWIASSHGNEDQLTLVCIVYVLVLVVKCASELLLTCGAYKLSAGEMWAGLIINKVTVCLLVVGVFACALLRSSVAMAVAAYAAILIGLSICIWLCAFQTYKIVAEREEPLLLRPESDDLDVAIGIQDIAMHV